MSKLANFLSFEEYRTRFQTAVMTREDGILEVRFHTEGGPMRWSHIAHHELSMIFKFIGADRENRIVILTGTGEEWSGPRSTWDTRVRATKPTSEEWDEIIYFGRQLEMNLLDIEVPVIAALNGPAYRHAELALSCDIVLAPPDAVFEDSGHFHHGTLVPGDGIYTVYSALLGVNRARYLHLMGTEINAEEALTLGLVGEVLPHAEIMPRARAIARQLAVKSDLVLRYTRLVFTQPMKEQMLKHLAHGLALEGLAAAAASSKYPGKTEGLR